MARIQSQTVAIAQIPLDLPSFTDHAVAVERPGETMIESTRPLGAMLRDTFKRNAKQKDFGIFCPDATNSNRLGAVFEVENRWLVSEIIPKTTMCRTTAG